MNQRVFSRRPTSNSAIPTIVFSLLIANGLIFALQQWNREFMLINFALWPATDPRSPFMIWQLLSYGFLHGGVNHIAFNMFGLWMFGSELERLWGARRFLIYFLICVVGAGLIQLTVAAIEGSFRPTVGASGGIFGILLAFGLTFPNRIIVPLFPPIPMRAITFVAIYGALELYMGLSRSTPGIANFAHLGGMLFGYFVLQYWKRSRQ